MEQENFHRRALTALANSVEARLEQVSCIRGERGNRQRNLAELFSREMLANQWFDFFCPGEPAPDFGDMKTDFSLLFFTWFPGAIEKFPAAFLRLSREFEM